MLRPLLSLGACLLVTAASPHAAAKSPPTSKPILLDKVVAVVGEATILRSEVLAAVKVYERALDERVAGDAREALHEQFLEHLIEQALVSRETLRLEITVTASEVEATKDRLAELNQRTREEYDAEVKERGLDDAAYDAEVRRQLLRGKWVAARVVPRMKVRPAGGDDPEAQAAFQKAMAAAEREAVAELRAATYVEVRW